MLIFYGLVDHQGRLMSNSLSGVPDGIFRTRAEAEGFARSFGGDWRVVQVDWHVHVSGNVAKAA
jgi:hypothetical protein